MKVLLLNNYAMESAWRRWQAGEWPANHLWGAAELSKHQIRVVIPRHRLCGPLADHSGLTRRFGNCDQQLRALVQQHRVDLIYSASAGFGDTTLLAELRRLGLLRRPLVALVHKAVGSATQPWHTYVNGHDLLLCLSEEIKNRLDQSYPHLRSKFRLLPWGVDLGFYPDLSQEKPTGTSYVIAAGKTRRDYGTLIAAVQRTTHPLFISCDERSAPAIDPRMKNVHIRTSLGVTTRELIADYRDAAAVAIPLTPRACDGTLIGITSLLEAMAMGKPVIMTRNTTIGIDIEQAGIGIWVEPGDVHGWEQAIRFMFDHPGDARRMGQTGRRMCEELFSMERFSTRLAGFFREAVHPRADRNMATSRWND